VRSEGFTLAELLVSVAVIGIMAVLGLDGGSDQLTRMQVEAAARRLAVGLERGRDAAERTGQGCALALGPDGWRGATAPGAIPCVGADTPLTEGLLPGDVVLASSFAGPSRFTANGLAIDGGTAVVGHAGTELVRCVVLSAPLGVIRVGRYAGAVAPRPLPEKCLPDSSL
jgi:prepilin-type N-terminal cleavage/methylation domain-containing protein